MKHIKTYLFMLAFAAAFTLPLQSYAQVKSFDRKFDSKSDAWWDNMGKQLAASLNKPVDQVRDETLQHIMFFANNYSDKIELNQLAPTLLDMYQNERNEARRTMAVMALHAIGNKQSMNRLAKLVEEEPPGTLRNITMALLADYKTNG